VLDTSRVVETRVWPMPMSTCTGTWNWFCWIVIWVPL